MIFALKDVSGAWLLGLGALLSGLGSFIASFGALRQVKRRADDDCDKRISQVQRAFDRGMKAASRRPEKGDDDRWSHLP